MKRKDEANFQPIRSTTQIWVVTRHQYGISALVSQTSFRGKTSGGVPKCRLFSQADKGGCSLNPFCRLQELSRGRLHKACGEDETPKTESARGSTTGTHL